MKTAAIAVVGILVFPAIACAQDYLNAWLTAEDFGRQLERTQESTKSGETARTEDDACTKAVKVEQRRLMLEHARKVLPEYHERLTHDGRDSADKWLDKVSDHYERQDHKTLQRKFSCLP